MTATQNFKPILFSTEMVQAILDGRKTQTRRVCKPQPEIGLLRGDLDYQWYDTDWECAIHTGDGFEPKYEKGDILWIRETFVDVGEKADQYFNGVRFHYKANEDFVGCWPWKPSIHMPKAAARIFLKVTDVRVERLQDISQEDAEAEGVKIDDDGLSCWNYLKNNWDDFAPEDSFESLWQKINGKTYPWEANPWVWVYTFERIEKPENFK